MGPKSNIVELKIIWLYIRNDVILPGMRLVNYIVVLTPTVKDSAYTFINVLCDIASCMNIVYDESYILDDSYQYNKYKVIYK